MFTTDRLELAVLSKFQLSVTVIICFGQTSQRVLGSLKGGLVSFGGCFGACFGGMLSVFLATAAFKWDHHGRWLLLSIDSEAVMQTRLVNHGRHAILWSAKLLVIRGNSKWEIRLEEISPGEIDQGEIQSCVASQCSLDINTGLPARLSSHGAGTMAVLL